MPNSFPTQQSMGDDLSVTYSKVRLGLVRRGLLAILTSNFAVHKTDPPDECMSMYLCQPLPFLQVSGWDLHTYSFTLVTPRKQIKKTWDLSYYSSWWPPLIYWSLVRGNREVFPQFFSRGDQHLASLAQSGEHWLQSWEVLGSNPGQVQWWPGHYNNVGYSGQVGN